MCDVTNSILAEDFERIWEEKIPWELLENKFVLITGANGMIARYLLFYFAYLVKKKNVNVRVYAQSRNKDELKRFLENLKCSEIECFDYDLKSKLETDDWVFHYIFHAASLASPDFYEVMPTSVILPNVIGTYWLCEYARTHSVCRLLFFSSSEIYGKMSDSVVSNYNEEMYGWIDPLDVRNCYSESKRMGENLCISYYKEYGIPINIVRIFHTYGPTMKYLNDNRVFCEFVRNVVNRKDIIIKGEGKAKRPFLYLSDACSALFFIILTSNSGIAYNMSNENQYFSINEFAEIVAETFHDRRISIKHEMRKEGEKYSVKKDENVVTGSSAKLKSLGWEAKVGVSEGIRRTVSFLERNGI